jgi:hypothetical protein
MTPPIISQLNANAYKAVTRNAATLGISFDEALAIYNGNCQRERANKEQVQQLGKKAARAARVNARRLEWAEEV